MKFILTNVNAYSIEILRIPAFYKIKFKGVIPTTREELVFGSTNIEKKADVQSLGRPLFNS